MSLTQNNRSHSTFTTRKIGNSGCAECRKCNQELWSRIYKQIYSFTTGLIDVSILVSRSFWCIPSSASTRGRGGVEVGCVCVCVCVCVWGGGILWTGERIARVRIDTYPNIENTKVPNQTLTPVLSVCLNQTLTPVLSVCLSVSLSLWTLLSLLSSMRCTKMSPQPFRNSICLKCKPVVLEFYFLIYLYIFPGGQISIITRPSGRTCTSLDPLSCKFSKVLSKIVDLVS